MFKQNRFFVEGEGNVKYTFNNGSIAQDPKLAVGYFLHALEKIPSMIEQYERETAKISKDLPVLREVVGSAWRREDELSGLKTELSALDRKILLSLKPIDEGEDKPDEKQKQENSPQSQSQHTDTNHNPDSIPVSGCLNEYREAMGDRLVIGSVPKPDSENRPAKGFKL